MKHDLNNRIKELELALNIILREPKIPFSKIGKILLRPISGTGLKKYWEKNNLELVWEVIPFAKIVVKKKG